MPMTSTIERLPDEERQAVETKLVRGVPKRTIADQHDLSPTAVQRHKDRIATKLQKAQKERILLDSERMVQEMQGLLEHLADLLQRSKEAEDRTNENRTVREIRQTWETVAKLAGAFPDRQSDVNHTLVILNALQDYPEARQRAARALIEAGIPIDEADA